MIRHRHDLIFLFVKWKIGKQGIAKTLVISKFQTIAVYEKFKKEFELRVLWISI